MKNIIQKTFIETSAINNYYKYNILSYRNIKTSVEQDKNYKSIRGELSNLIFSTDKECESFKNRLEIIFIDIFIKNNLMEKNKNLLLQSFKAKNQKDANVDEVFQIINNEYKKYIKYTNEQLKFRGVVNLEDLDFSISRSKKENNTQDLLIKDIIGNALFNYFASGSQIFSQKDVETQFLKTIKLYGDTELICFLDKMEKSLLSSEVLHKTYRQMFAKFLNQTLDNILNPVLTNKI